MSRSKLTAAALLTAALLFACAPDPSPLFTPPPVPADPAKFNAGQIGLLTPELVKEQEFIAFRLLSGLSMQEAPTAGARKPSLEDDPSNTLRVGQEAWQAARRGITDPPGPNYIDPYRNERVADKYVSYENCHADAFETAAHTLQDRRTVYHSETALKSWVIAQDQVFTDCATDKPLFPDPLPASDPVLARADRDYQIAASHFYAEDLPGAETRFREISTDDHSPWRDIAAYLVGRTLLRQASLQGNSSALAQAREQFTRIGQTSSSLAPSARALVEHLDAIEHASTTLQLLSQRLLTPQPPADKLANAIAQSAFILRASSFKPALSDAHLPESFDWVQSLEQSNAVHANQQWKARKATPWLVLSLMFARGSDADAPDLLAAADRLPPASPAFGTAAYNAIRLRLERGETSALSTKLDSLLAAPAEQPSSLVNAWRAERLRVALDFNDFLHWAARTPSDGEGASDPVIAYDAAHVLNQQTPLSKLTQAAHSALFPPWSAENVALAAWTRAFMLADFDTLRDLSPIIAHQHPDWASSLSPPAGPGMESWSFKGALLIALHHEFNPMVNVAHKDTLDESSWWCAIHPSQDQSNPQPENDIAWRLPAAFVPSNDVLSASEREMAARELAQLEKQGSAAAVTSKIIFAWAKAHPEDPQVPQALHRVVMVTRYGCQTDEGAISKTAFDLLHTRYPKDHWTAKTPYWFGAK